MQKNIAVINLNAIRQNALYVRGILKDKFFFAVVKADAYGHGAAQTALAIEDVVDGFCVAIFDEGAALRLAGIKKPILVFTPPLGADDIIRADYYGLTLTVNSAASARAAGVLPCHIKVNTGMNRIGCAPEKLGEVLKYAKNVQGVYSHLYAPHSEKRSSAQLKVFLKAAEEVKQKFPQAMAHISSSGGLLCGGQYIMDGARAGILLYGYAPHGFSAPVKKALTVYAKRVQATPFTGGGCGYAPATKNYKNLYTYRLGYADGFLRGVPIGEGNLCMDSFISTKNAKYFPVLTDAEKYAKSAGTISYEVLCNATRRSQRIYVYE